MSFHFDSTTMHFITRVSRFFDNNFVTLSWITIRFQHNFFLHPYVIFSSHTTFLNYSTNEFTLVNNSLLSQIVALERRSPTSGRLFTTTIYIGTDAPMEEDDLTSENNLAIRCEVRREYERLIKKVNENPERCGKMERSTSGKEQR